MLSRTCICYADNPSHKFLLLFLSLYPLFHLIRRESPFSSRESLFIAPPPSFQYSFHCSFELPYIRDLLETGEDTRDDFDDLFLRQKKRKGERRGEEGGKDNRSNDVYTNPKERGFFGGAPPRLAPTGYIYIYVYTKRVTSHCQPTPARDARTHAHTQRRAFSWTRTFRAARGSAL